MVSVEVRSITSFQLLDEDTLKFIQVIEKCLRSSHTEDPFSLTPDEYRLLGRLQKDLEKYKTAIHRFKE